MNQSILAKLEQLSMRLEEINALLSDQSVASDQNKFRELSIEHSQLSPVNDKYKEYLSTIDNINAAKKLLEGKMMTSRKWQRKKFHLDRKF